MDEIDKLALLLILLYIFGWIGLYKLIFLLFFF
jgi:hypothetical protein